MEVPFQTGDITDIRAFVTNRTFPSIIQWNRLEARPRTAEFDRTLKAEIRDPLWMLTRQWQTGEFIGDDAGSPVFAKIRVDSEKFTRYRASDKAAQSFSQELPVEAQVEQRTIPWDIRGQAVSYDVRLLMGRHWMKLLKKGTGDQAVDESIIEAYLKVFAIKAPDPTNPEDAYITAHKEGWQRLAAVAGRSVMDGYEWYRHIKDPTTQPLDAIVGEVDEGVLASHEFRLEDLINRFVNWFESLFVQPIEPDNNAWKPSYLEYQFSCSVPGEDGEKVYDADEYYHGKLDWYNIDLNDQKNLIDQEEESPAVEDATETIVASFIPVPLEFDGMPNTRWWAFEDRKTNFGKITPKSTDLGSLLLMEFGLIYANDWFIVPQVLEAGTVTDIRGMAVTNVFGERFWIEPTGKRDSQTRESWAMFKQNKRGQENSSPDSSLVILPTVPKIQESRPLEEVRMIRDEVANMVWGIESQILLPSGQSKAGSEAAIETRAYYQRLFDDENNGPELPPYRAPISYTVMNSIPEHWIPFIPVHIENSNREIQLQRAVLPRVIEDLPDELVRVEPRTVLMREGLDQENPSVFYVHEEEVPRAGIRLTQAYQRTRWYGGKVVTWLGIRKQVGRGSGSSGLASDFLKDVEVPEEEQSRDT